MSEFYEENPPDHVVLVDPENGAPYDLSGEAPTGDEEFELNEPVCVIPCDPFGVPYEI